MAKINIRKMDQFCENCVRMVRLLNLEFLFILLIYLGNNKAYKVEAGLI